jgi:thiol-disulfide isomerase/thioredoxin
VLHKLTQARPATIAVMAIVFTLYLPSMNESAREALKPDLSLKDLRGKRTHLRDYQGEIVVLNFWATWCGPCSEELPVLVEMEKRYRERGVVFVGVSMDDEKAQKKIPTFLHQLGVGFPVWVGATADDLERLHMGQAIPATAFFDEQGQIVARVLGEMREGEIRERLDWLTGHRSGPAPDAVVTHLADH